VNVTSASQADAFGPATAGTGAGARILVWDAPVRVFHWLMALSFAGAYLTAETERWRLLHVTLGYTVAGLVVFRVLWGLFGTRHARFASFVRGPSAAWRHLRSLASRQPEHHAGHNPAGALAIVGLLALAALAALSGWATYHEVAGEWAEALHEFAGNLMLALVLVHLAGVLVGSWVQRENLVRAMVTGFKHGRPQDGIRRAWTSLAVLMLVAVLGFWAWQWQTAPAGGALDGTPPALGRQGGGHDHDQDDD
jgi:cytochrome b